LKFFSFPKSKRLISNKQFRAVLARRLCADDGLLAIYIAENNCQYWRLGVSVGKSCGNAVVRNRLKRLLKEAFRQSQDRIPAGFDYLIMISPRRSRDSKQTTKQLTFEQIRASLVALIGEAVRKIGRK